MTLMGWEASMVCGNYSTLGVHNDPGSFPRGVSVRSRPSHAGFLTLSHLWMSCDSSHHSAWPRGRSEIFQNTNQINR